MFHFVGQVNNGCVGQRRERKLRAGEKAKSDGALVIMARVAVTKTRISSDRQLGCPNHFVRRLFLRSTYLLFVISFLKGRGWIGGEHDRLRANITRS